jgi:ribosome-binding factor A
MSGAKNRRDRLGVQIRSVVAQCLLLEAKDPGLRAVDVTDVVVSPDLGHAKIYYYARGDEEDLIRLDAALDRARGFLRRRVGQEIRARVTPDLAFYYDHSIEQGAYMETLLDQVKATDEAFAIEHRGNKVSLSEADASVDDASVDDASVDDA